MSTIKAVLFDLDGVLVDSRMLHFEAFNRALTLHGFDALTWKEHVAEYDGLPTKEKLKILVRKRRVFDNDTDSIRALKQKETHTLLRERVEFNPTMLNLWTKLREDGLKIGVVTNAVRDTANWILNRMCLEPQVLVTNEDCRPKPHPEPYLLAPRWFSLPLSPGECLVIEDGKYGVQSAREAGCWVLEVDGPEDVTLDNIRNAIEEANK